MWQDCPAGDSSRVSLCSALRGHIIMIKNLLFIKTVSQLLAGGFLTCPSGGLADGLFPDHSPHSLENSLSSGMLAVTRWWTPGFPSTGHPLPSVFDISIRVTKILAMVGVALIYVYYVELEDKKCNWRELVCI